MRVLVLLLLGSAATAVGAPTAEAGEAEVEILTLSAADAEGPADVGPTDIAVELRMQGKKRPEGPDGQLGRWTWRWVCGRPLLIALPLLLLHRSTSSCGGTRSLVGRGQRCGAGIASSQSLRAAEKNAK